MAVASTWQFVVTDLAGQPLGELTHLTARQVVRALSAPSTASATMLASDPMLSTVLTTDLNLKAYRNQTLMFHGPVIMAELSAPDPTGTPSVQISAADPTWRFDHRVAGKTAQWTSGFQGYLINGADRLTAAETLIGQANSDNETGVQTLGQTCGSTAVKLVTYQKLSEAINDLGNTLNGFDWICDPIEYASAKIGQFRAAAALGSTQTGAVFEYQGRVNMRAPNYQRGIADMTNKVYSIPDAGPASPAGGGVLTAQDTTSQTARGLYEEVVDTSGITDQTTRQAVLNDHILYRKNPRQVITFSPDFDDGTGRVPVYGRDYTVADYVRARILYRRAVLIDGYVRVYKMQFDIDENNKETLTPTLVSES